MHDGINILTKNPVKDIAKAISGATPYAANKITNMPSLTPTPPGDIGKRPTVTAAIV